MNIKVSESSAPASKSNYPKSGIKNDIPLCVDCDGTLIYSDLLHESFLALCKKNLFTALKVPFWLLFKGKAYTKLRIADEIDIDPATLPYCESVVTYVRDQRQSGRSTALVTASAEKYANGIANHLGIFDLVIGTSDPSFNLAGDKKAETLAQRFPAIGFEYIGNSRSDLPVWKRARIVSIANASNSIESIASEGAKLGLVVRSPHKTIASIIRAFRPHQWLKNFLIFIPLLAAHKIGDSHSLSNALIAFVSFSLCASSVYILNDLLDVNADRKHLRKKNRPFASGAVSVPFGLFSKAILLCGALALALMLPPIFGVCLAAYYALTVAYSVKLKSKVVVDVMLLSFLYTSRILAGAAATTIAPSFWLLAFSIFIFLSLALVKRYAELLQTLKNNKVSAAGRGYRTDDLLVLMTLGTASAYSASLILALYINSPDVSRAYSHPYVLWPVIPLIVYWTSRVWLKTHRGEMHDDPIVFAATDWQSLIIVSAMAILGMLAL